MWENSLPAFLFCLQICLGLCSAMEHLLTILQSSCVFPQIDANCRITTVPPKNVLILKSSRRTSNSNPKRCIALVFNYCKYNIRKVHHWFWHHLILFPILKETLEDAKYVLLLNTVWFIRVFFLFFVFSSFCSYPKPLTIMQESITLNIYWYFANTEGPFSFSKF